MKYKDLVEVYEDLEKTSKRLEKTYIISEFLKTISETALKETALLLQGRVFPQWDERKIGVASRLVLKAISQATGTSTDKIEKQWAKVGDLGNVAAEFIKSKKQATLFSTSLTVKKVFDNIQKLATLEGAGTVNKKVGLIAELLTSAKPNEAKYIVRTLLEELRVGIAKGTLRDAIVWAFFPKAGITYNKEEKSIDVTDREIYNQQVGLVQKAYDMSNDFALVAEKAKQGKIKTISLKIGIPIKAMLGPKEADAKAALERVGSPCQAEYKYDGFRIQVHKDNNKITLFTRNLENVTKQFPDVVKYVKAHVKGKGFILDSEAVGFNPMTKAYLPFQNVSQRIRRKYHIEQMAKDFPVELNIFDCMAYKGESMIQEPFEKRRALLKKIVTPIDKKIVLSKAKLVKNEKETDEFYKKSLSDSQEGLMLKKLDAPYSPGARVGSMVKLKGTKEPLDLVIIKAQWGEGKRAKWFSSFTLACLDKNEKFVEIGKVGTGIKEKSDTQTTKESDSSRGVTFTELTKLLKPLILSQKGKTAIVKPKIVVEIAYEEIQKSVNYSSGYALRFPRVIRLRHMEKSPKDINTVKDVEKYYKEQTK
ncbi:ATP-dependent DNA ligase [Candidatus Woesearchaeota archaeon]|nr:ATP-dependent DNA ligase [Candidatus Woesearchaeota archaeon]